MSPSTLVGLADTGRLFGTCYAAISRDNGTAWTIDSPQFSHAGADGPGVTDALLATGGGVLVAWGHNGNNVKVSADKGATWYQTGFPEGMDRVGEHGHVLIARETNFTHFGKRLPDLVYRSDDGGHVWRRSGR